MDDISVRKLAIEALWVAMAGLVFGVLLVTPLWRHCCGGYGDALAELLVPAFIVSITITEQVRPLSFMVGVCIQFLGMWYPLRLCWLLAFPPSKKSSTGRAYESY